MQLLNQKLNTKINSIQAKLQKFPEGNLICARNDKRYKWYVSDGHNKTYLPKKERKLAEKLAEKKYLNLLLEELEEEKSAIESYFESSHKKRGNAEKLIENSTEYQDLLNSKYIPLSKELSDWKEAPYEKKSGHQDGLTIKTISGNYVRSKSENIIDMLLHIHRIPYRYEAPLHLNGIILYPDFTIRHPKTGRYYYWEHFGMMDNQAYTHNMCSKMQLYVSNNIIPGIQLLTTYETKDNPLDSDVVEKIIKYYFIEN